MQMRLPPRRVHLLRKHPLQHQRRPKQIPSQTQVQTPSQPAVQQLPRQLKPVVQPQQHQEQQLAPVGPKRLLRQLRALIPSCLLVVSI